MICVTGSTKEERDRVRAVVECHGGVYSSTMVSNKCTHLLVWTSTGNTCILLHGNHSDNPIGAKFNCAIIMFLGGMQYQRNNCCHASLYMHHRMDEARDKAPLLILMVVSR